MPVMTTTRPRRIVRRALMVVAVLLMMIPPYLASVTYLLLARATGSVPAITRSSAADWYVRPVVAYAAMDKQWLGSGVCQDLVRWSETTGQRLKDE